MAVEGVNSNSTLIQGTQQNNAVKTTETKDEGTVAKLAENNTEQENTKTASASVNQDSGTTNGSDDPGTLLDVLA
ncbi:MAG: hypothetical protein ACUZ8E_00900 [Candidatus Anammoxibacter sp.]